MSLRQPKTKKQPNAIEIEKLIREQGAKPFDVNEKIEDSKISDDELEKFLTWRREIRESEREASKNWQF